MARDRCPVVSGVSAATRKPALAPPLVSRLAVAATALLAIHALLIFSVWAGWLRLPHLGPGEVVFVANAAACWKSGHLPYTRFTEIPACWSPYGPVFQGICALLPMPDWNPYLAGRLVSVAAFAGATAVVVVWGRARGSLAGGILAALLLLTGRAVFAYAPVYRVDMLTSFLSAAGFAAVVLDRRPAVTWLGIAALAAAFDTKLTAIGAPAAAVLCLWPVDRRRAITVAVGWLVLALLSLGLIQWASHGAYLYDVGIISDTKKLLKGLEIALLRPLENSLFWIAGLGFSLWLLGRPALRALLPELCYLGVFLLITIATGSKPGASWNYLMDPYLGLALLTAGVIPLLRRREPENVRDHSRTLALPHPRTAPESRLLLVPAGALLAQTLFAFPFSHFVIHTEVMKRHPNAERDFERARAALAPQIRPGANIAALTDAGMDALLSYGTYSRVSVTPGIFNRKRNALLREALSDHRLDFVLGGNFESWPSANAPSSAPAEAPAGEEEER